MFLKTLGSYSQRLSCSKKKVKKKAGTHCARFLKFRLCI